MSIVIFYNKKSSLRKYIVRRLSDLFAYPADKLGKASHNFHFGIIILLLGCDVSTFRTDLAFLRTVVTCAL